MLERDELILELGQQISDAFPKSVLLKHGTILSVDFKEMATAVYNAGYRKQSEPEQDRKYRHAVLVLQAIAQRSGGDGESWNDYGMASAFCDCREAAERCLKYLGEDTKMPNREKTIPQK